MRDMLAGRLKCSCGDFDCEHLTADQKRDFYSGAYECCRMLLTSPAMERPQRDAIEDMAFVAQVHLEALGVTFALAPQT